MGWRQFLFILMVVLVGGTRGLGGVIVVGAATGVALAALTLELGQAYYAQLILITGFVVFLKWHSRRVAETGKV
jgi:branched-chain amino acid transport system permease protein/urea transport system permease protein